MEGRAPMCSDDTPSTIWLVIRHDYEDSDRIAAYSDEIRAHRVKSALGREHTSESYGVEAIDLNPDDDGLVLPDVEWCYEFRFYGHRHDQAGQPVRRFNNRQPVWSIECYAVDDPEVRTWSTYEHKKVRVPMSMASTPEDAYRIACDRLGKYLATEAKEAQR